MICTDVGPGSRPGVVLWNAALTWQRAMTAALRPLDITPAQFVVLDSIASFEDGPRPSQFMVAARAGTGLTMTSQLITKLVAAGLVLRSPNPADGRANQVGLTSRGLCVARSAADRAAEVDRKLFQNLRPELTRLRDVVDAHTATPRATTRSASAANG